MDEFQVELFDLEEDYPEWATWWERKNAHLPAEFLPPKGLMVKHQGDRICAGFLIGTEGRVIALGNVAANPITPKPLRNDALDILLSCLMRWCKDLGYTLVCVSTNVEPLKKRYERLGFEKTDENVTHYGRKL